MNDKELRKRVMTIVEGFMGGTSPDNPMVAPSQKDSNSENSQGFEGDEQAVYDKVTAAKKTLGMSDIGATKIGGMNKIEANNILNSVGDGNQDEDLSDDEVNFVQSLLRAVKGKL